MSYENILLKCLTERVRLNDPFHENMSCWGMRGNRINRGEGQPGILLLAEQRRGWRLMIFCARATRDLRRPSLDARSRRSISPHP